jgi:hypothetical protein
LQGRIEQLTRLIAFTHKSSLSHFLNRGEFEE